VNSAKLQVKNQHAKISCDDGSRPCICRHLQQACPKTSAAIDPSASTPRISDHTLWRGLSLLKPASKN